MKKALKKLDNKGFTLVELIIVIAIIAVLAAVLAPQYLKYVERSREAADANNCVEMIHAVQVAAADPDFTGTKGAVTFAVTNEGKVSISGADTKDSFAALVASMVDVDTITMKSTDGKKLGNLATTDPTTGSVTWSDASQTAVDKLNDGVATKTS
jgi:prepilin-type N-terminal cleavage/methylation domain-containing protein